MKNSERERILTADPKNKKDISFMFSSFISEDTAGVTLFSPPSGWHCPEEPLCAFAFFRDSFHKDLLLPSSQEVSRECSGSCPSGAGQPSECPQCSVETGRPKADSSTDWRGSCYWCSRKNTIIQSRDLLSSADFIVEYLCIKGEVVLFFLSWDCCARKKAAV